VYLKNHPPKDRSIPGPGNYSEGPKLGEKAVKVTMKGRTSNPCKECFILEIYFRTLNKSKICTRTRSI